MQTIHVSVQAGKSRADRNHTTRFISGVHRAESLGVPPTLRHATDCRLFRWWYSPAMPRKKADAEVSLTPASSNLYSVHLYITEAMLGTAPSSPTIYADFVASKKFAAEKKVARSVEELQAIADKETALIKEELAQLPPEDEAGKGVTVFRRNKGGLILNDVMIRGFLKEGSAAMGLAGSSWGLTSKIDRWIFVTDHNKLPIREIPIFREDGSTQVKEPDCIFERPLRAMTQRGPRVTLAASELVNPVSVLKFHLFVLPMGVSKGLLTQKVLTEWLSYGVYSGLGQYRTGSYGRFTTNINAVEPTLAADSVSVS